jgi:hypothetical protein
MTSRGHPLGKRAYLNQLLYFATSMSGLVSLFVSSLDTRSERRFDLQLPISQLKVSNLTDILSLYESESILAGET